MNNKRIMFEQYSDSLARLYPEFTEGKTNVDGGGKNSLRFLTRSVTFQVTDNCNLACSYCYQINKGKRKMSFEVAKKYVDLLLSGDKGFKEYGITPELSKGIITEFIGGEPFLEVELIDDICDYMYTRMILTDHPWLKWWRISICSNGVLYRDPRVQAFLAKWRNRLSFSVTIDGNKELHDSCRVFPDGSPSYDLAFDAASDWMAKGFYMGSKITIAPGNVDYLLDAIKHMVDSGYEEINANCVYEEGWNNELANKFYHKLIEVSDYFIDNDLVDSHYLSLFVEDFFHPKKVDDLQCWCGGTGMMLACDPDGKLFPCLRYMESSVGTDVPAYTIGDVDAGIGSRCYECERIDCMNAVDRRSQSNDECFYCPIAEGCSYCSAYNYQTFGTPDSRATFICCMHKARALANAYFWSRWNIKTNNPKITKLWVPKEWALEIITEDEWDDLINVPNIEVCRITKGVEDEAYTKGQN